MLTTKTRLVALKGRVHGPVDRHCVVSQSASCVDLTGIARPMAPCPVEILHKQIFLFISTVQHLGNITDYGQRLMEEQVCHPGSVGDLGEGQAWRQVAEEIETATDEWIELLVVGECSDGSVYQIALSCDEPKGINRVGVRFTYISPNMREVTRRF